MKVAEPWGQPCAVCVCILVKGGGAWEGGEPQWGHPGADPGDRQLRQPRGFLSWAVAELGLWQEGNSSLTLPVSAVAGFLPCCPLPQGQAGWLAPTICKSWGNSPLFPSKGIFLP